MSQMSNTVYKSFVAGQVFTDENRWHFVTMDGANTVKLAGATDTPIGVLADFVTGASGTAVTVAIGGTSKVKAGGSIAQNDFVGSGASGVAVEQADGIARALALSDAEEGDIVEVLLLGPIIVPSP